MISHDIAVIFLEAKLAGSALAPKETDIMINDVANHTVNVTQTGIGIGAAIAIVCSWERSRSILWAILAGVLSWFYVIYFAATRKADERR